jgi:hypothetical protein
MNKPVAFTLDEAKPGVNQRKMRSYTDLVVPALMGAPSGCGMKNLRGTYAP